MTAESYEFFYRDEYIGFTVCNYYEQFSVAFVPAAAFGTADTVIFVRVTDAEY